MSGQKPSQQVTERPVVSNRTEAKKTTGNSISGTAATLFAKKSADDVAAKAIKFARRTANSRGNEDNSEKENVVLNKP